MSRKNTLLKFQIITAGNGSGDLTSTITNIQHLDNVGIQVNLSGTPSMTGTFKVQVSADHAQDTEGNVSVAGNWTTIVQGGVSGGSPTTTYFDLNQLSSPWIRLIYTHVSGSGTVNAFITAKML